MRVIVRTIGNIPDSWKYVLFDNDGQHTTDPTKGRPLELWGEKRPLVSLIQGIWDRPHGDMVNTGTIQEEQLSINTGQLDPYPSCFPNMFWKAFAVRIDNVFRHGCNDGTDKLLRAMLKSSQQESTLLYDLPSKILQVIPCCLLLIVSFEGLSSGIRCNGWLDLWDEGARKMEFDTCTLVESDFRG